MNEQLAGAVVDEVEKAIVDRFGTRLAAGSDEIHVDTRELANFVVELLVRLGESESCFSIVDVIRGAKTP